MSVINLTNKYLEELWDLRDKRMDSYPLMASPWQPIGLCMAYLVMVTIVIPLFMRNRPAYHLKGPMFIYNLASVLCTSWMLKEVLMSGWLTHYSFRCQPPEYGLDEKSLRMANVFWLFFLSRFFEFIDTFFFLLRKKTNQVTFLHVYHHTITPLFAWPWTRYMPGGHPSFPGMVNGIVHIFMYTYYLLAGLGPSVQKYLWWKKYLTQLQLVQFVLVSLHAAQLFFVDDCGMPWQYAYAICGLNLIFVILFSNFYLQSYTRRRQSVQNGQAVKLE